MTTWGGVHVDDSVRGADQRAWTVTSTRLGVTWLISGKTDVTLTLRRGDREVTTRRTTDELVDLVERADHTATAAAFTALAGLNPELLEETTLTTTIDPFTAPSTTPAAVKRDRFGRYLLPDPETGRERAWTRATTVARTLADEYHLTLWKMRMVAKGLAMRPDLVAGAAAADLETDKGMLNKITEQAMERAGAGSGANLGTALHSFTERVDRKVAAVDVVPMPLNEDVAAYLETLERHRLRVHQEWIERIVVLPELGIAGTLDRIVGQPTGVTKSSPLTVLDLKTAKSIDYSMLEIAIQLGLYAKAPLMWDPATGQYEPMPAVDQDRALVLHLPVGKARGQVYGVNIIEGWEYGQLAMCVRAARSAGKGLGWLVEPEPADLALHRVRRASGRTELARLWDRLHPQGLWTEEVNAAATARMTELATANA